MKKIFFSVLAIAAIAACTKSEVAYDDTPQEIGFVAVANNITKAPVSGTTYPEGLNMYVNAYVHADNAPTSPDYISNGEFVKRGYQVDSKNVWGGKTPYYWPNQKTLHFSGFSKSGSFYALTEAPATTGEGLTAAYDPKEDALTIKNYSPLTGTKVGENDLMWFPSTKNTKSEGYGKDTKYVPVNMYHTCSWITFLVQGDATTGNKESTYKITGLTMNGVDMTANVVCTGNVLLSQATLPTYVVWSANTDKTGDNTTYTVTLPDGGVELKSTYVTTTDDNGTVSTPTPKNIETADNTTNKTTGGNIVVIPQSLPFPTTNDEDVTTYSAGPKITLKYEYESPASTTEKPIIIKEEISDLPLTIDSTVPDNNKWEPGKHYVYTITIKANEILIAPTPVEWVDGTAGNVTVQ